MDREVLSGRRMNLKRTKKRKRRRMNRYSLLLFLSSYSVLEMNCEEGSGASDEDWNEDEDRLHSLLASEEREREKQWREEGTGSERGM